MGARAVFLLKETAVVSFYRVSQVLNLCFMYGVEVEYLSSFVSMFGLLDAVRTTE